MLSDFPKPKALTAIVLCSAVTLSACSNPVRRIGDVGGANMLALDASQRLVISGTRRVLVRDGHDRVVFSPNGDPVYEEHTVICAEPSPDAIVATAAYFSGGVTAGGDSANATSGFNEAVSNISIRTQTIQLLRDGYYRVCEAYMNGAIGSLEYREIVGAIDHFMAVLVSIEAIAGSPINIPVTISAGANITQAAQVQDDDSSGAGVQGANVSSASGSNVTAEGIAQLTEALRAAAAARESSAHQSAAIREILLEFLGYLERLRAHRAMHMQ